MVSAGWGCLSAVNDASGVGEPVPEALYRHAPMAAKKSHSSSASVLCL